MTRLADDLVLTPPDWPHEPNGVLTPLTPLKEPLRAILIATLGATLNAARALTGYVRDTGKNRSQEHC
jgi:hypothetical protein